MTISLTEELERFAKAVEFLPVNTYFADAIVDWIQWSNSGKVTGTVLSLLKEKNLPLYTMVEHEFACQIRCGLDRNF
jgi:hypothetical protein